MWRMGGAEDIVEGVGELLIVPKSHKWDYFRYSDVGLSKPTKPSEIKANYSEYEKWVVEKLKPLMQIAGYDHEGRTGRL